MTAGPVPGRPSDSVKSRPNIGRIPSNEKYVAVTTRPRSFSATTPSLKDMDRQV
jgi:hypothetical protein